jgi:hypothetical protein
MPYNPIKCRAKSQWMIWLASIPQQMPFNAIRNPLETRQRLFFSLSLAVPRSAPSSSLNLPTFGHRWTIVEMIIHSYVNQHVGLPVSIKHG